MRPVSSLVGVQQVNVAFLIINLQLMLTIVIIFLKTDYEFPDTLQKASVITISNEECQKKYEAAKIFDGQICIYDRSMKTSSCTVFV